MEVEAWLVRVATVKPGHDALDTPGERCTYGELLIVAWAVAREFAECEVHRGDRVAIALPPGRDFAYALHACLLLGAVAVPIDLRLSMAERRTVAKGAAIVVDESWSARLAAAAAHAGASAGIRAARLQTGHVHHDLDATAVVIHTSGTSSAPKPIELTYGNLLWSALGSAVALGLDQRERWLCALPLSHVGGLSILVRSVIYGTTAVIHERFETERVLHALREERITLASLVATTLARLLDAGLERPPALRCALTGGGPVPAALVQRAAEAGVPVCMTYGLTESCSQVTTTPVAALEVGERAAGPPLFCTRVLIAPDGEILVAGPTVAPGAREEDGWLHTGDLGALDEQERLSVTGRKADTIITGGENVAPSELEAVLEAHPAVREAAVVGVTDERWGEAVVAIVVACEGEAPDNEELRAHCAAALAPYKVPKRILLRAEPLPRTRSGKLLRREL
jgi:o-succinylbenzoate---CoA ligase